MTPAQLPRVSGEHADIEAAFERACEEGDGQLVVMWHVELVETRPLAIGFGNFFNRRATGCAQAVGEVELLRDSGDGKFAKGVVYLIDANRSESKGSRD